MFAQHPGKQGKEAGREAGGGGGGGRRGREERKSHCSKVRLGFLECHSLSAVWVTTLAKVNITIIIAASS